MCEPGADDGSSGDQEMWEHSANLEVYDLDGYQVWTTRWSSPSPARAWTRQLALSACWGPLIQGPRMSHKLDQGGGGRERMSRNSIGWIGRGPGQIPRPQMARSWASIGTTGTMRCDGAASCDLEQVGKVGRRAHNIGKCPRHQCCRPNPTSARPQASRIMGAPLRTLESDRPFKTSPTLARRCGWVASRWRALPLRRCLRLRNCPISSLDREGLNCPVISSDFIGGA